MTAEQFTPQTAADASDPQTPGSDWPAGDRYEVVLATLRSLFGPPAPRPHADQPTQIVGGYF